MLGCAPVHKLLDLGAIIDIKKIEGIESPRKFADYELTIHEDRLPTGVELIVK
jgi:CRISPR-associated protein Csd2